MDYEFRPEEAHETRLQKTLDTVRQTRDLISISKKEMADTQRAIQFSQEAIRASRKLIPDYQS